jgi:hypothetical protein
MLHEIQGCFAGAIYGGYSGTSGYGTPYASRYGTRYLGRDFRWAISDELSRTIVNKVDPSKEEPFLVYTLSNIVLGVDTSIVIPTSAELVSAFLNAFPQYKLYSFLHVDSSFQAGHMERMVTVCFAAKEVPEPPVVFSPAELAAVKAEIREKIYLELRKEITTMVYDLVSEI